VDEYRVDIMVAADHPSLPGHFPGKPVVPGVLLLARVVTAYRESHPEARIEAIPQVKFLSPLLPSEHCSTVFRDINGGRVAFECRVGERIVARGALIFASP
jgi:3-hydroxyacyl-[acyl-carrier-protein] dehydratase